MLLTSIITLFHSFLVCVSSGWWLWNTGSDWFPERHHDPACVHIESFLCEVLLLLLRCGRRASCGTRGTDDSHGVKSLQIISGQMIHMG